MSQISQFLASQTIENLENHFPGQTPDPILCVKATDSVQEVLKALLQHNIHAAPVIDPQQAQTSNGTPFLAIINVVDLLTAFAFQPVFNEFDPDMNLNDLKEDTLKKVFDQQNSVLKSSIKDFLGLSLEGQRLWVFTEKDTLDKLFDAFSVGVHRVLVSHESRGVPYWTFISQTDVLLYLKNQSFNIESQLHDIFLEPICKLKMGTLSKEKILTVNYQNSAMFGFRVMLQHKELSAIPVVDNDGMIMDTLSASDFRFVNLDNLKDTLLPVIQFLKKDRGLMEKDLIIGVQDEELYSIVDKLLLHRDHRVWIVDRKKTPIGCVSLTDIIRSFSDYAPKVLKTPLSPTSPMPTTEQIEAMKMMETMKMKEKPMSLPPPHKVHKAANRTKIN